MYYLIARPRTNEHIDQEGRAGANRDLLCRIGTAQKKHMNIEILSGSNIVAAFVDQVQLAADTEKDALGFLPERAFKEAADQGKLLVAVVRQGNTTVYAGHLMHGGVFPQARIFQVYTCPEFRRNGIARRLVEAIVRKAEALQFMSVLAQVADDLVANRFWEQYGIRDYTDEARRAYETAHYKRADPGA